MGHVKEVGQRIRQLRESLGLSQAEFAKLLGKSLRTVQRWERGEVQRIPSTVLEHISKVTGASLEWLKEGIGEPFHSETETFKENAPIDVDLLNFITLKVLEAYKKGEIPRTADEYFLLDLIKLAYRKLKPIKDKKQKELMIKELEKLLLKTT